MSELLKKPYTNAICIGLFTAFYTVLFCLSAANPGFAQGLYFVDGGAKVFFWSAWSALLAAGNHVYIALALCAVTLLVIVLLLRRKRPYDEYQLFVLLRCLSAAIVLTLIAIAIFYSFVLLNAAGIVEKFTFFVVLQWAVVVLADLCFVLICR